MSTWLEIRCELRSEPGSSDKCWSDNDSGPMQMASDNQKSILSALRQMHAEAKKAGWVKSADGWVCPHCAGGIKDQRGLTTKSL